MLAYLGQNPRSVLKAMRKATSLCKALNSLLTIKHSRTSVKETSCEANKIQYPKYPKLPYFTLNISKYTIRDLED